jgi:hypothetical protein
MLTSRDDSLFHIQFYVSIVAGGSPNKSLTWKTTSSILCCNCNKILLGIVGEDYSLQFSLPRGCQFSSILFNSDDWKR